VEKEFDKCRYLKTGKGVREKECRRVRKVDKHGENFVKIVGFKYTKYFL
jgi:hypothetical protein